MVKHMLCCCDISQRDKKLIIQIILTGFEIDYTTQIHTGQGFQCSIIVICQPRCHLNSEQRLSTSYKRQRNIMILVRRRSLALFYTYITAFRSM